MIQRLQITLRLKSLTYLSRAFTIRVSTALPFTYLPRVKLAEAPLSPWGFPKVRGIHKMNGISPRTKRKQHPGSAIERPQKQHKLSTGMNSNLLDIDASSYDDDMEVEVEDSRVAPGLADTAEWQACIEKVVRNVVSIRFCQTCSFDSESAVNSEATGFVVDAENGYIMTNRHVVGAGPFWGYCIFDNHEEVDTYPVYRDPVHDFGILRFDPKAIKYMPVTVLTLRPDLAKVGSEIRVVGNDAGEKLSILSGVISRLDRNAPEYGDGYCDFNTNYIQAAAAASGGSSGSPVVNIDGYAVALQAGGRSDGAATDYFLPLDRPLRALRCIQEGKKVTRGTIQCQWMIKPFDECRRLGLTMQWESAIRKNFPKETGMLVAEIVLPEGPSDHKVEEGDVLVKVNGELLTQFIRLDEILDSSVGGKVNLLLQRGGEDVEVEVGVGDLHEITPDRFVSVSGGSFHNLSYQQARLYAVACKGVYVCEATGSFRFEHMECGWIIQTVDHKKTPDLDTFIEVMKMIPDRARVVVTYKHLRDLHTLNTSILTIDRHWSQKMRLAVRNDNTGLWDFTDIGEALPALPPVPRSASFIQLSNTQHPAAADIVRSFVRVLCHMPIKLDGFPRNRKWGMGVVIDADKGLVVVSRAIIPYDLCDIIITIADSIIVEGKVIFMHPLQNYAVIKYDPSLVDAPVQSAKLSNTHITQGASTYFVGFNQNMRIVIAQTTVTDITAVAIPANTVAPRYRAVNVDAITVDTSLSSQCGSGVLVGEDGTVQALWLTYLGERSPSTQKDTDYHLGLATPCLLPVISKIQEGERPHLRMLSVEFNAIQMSQARIMGVSEEWIKRVAEDNHSRHQLFMVRKRTFERGDETAALLEGDVILTLNGKIITRVSELDVMYDHDFLDATILRDCVEMNIKLPTVSADDLETDRAVNFCGAVLHRPHHAVRQQISKLHSEVYVSARTRGSPAYQYGLTPTNFVTHVNGKPTKDIEDFLKVVIPIPDNTYFRVRAMTFDNVPWVITMKKNDHYFPTTEWIKNPSEPSAWSRITYEKGQPVAGEGYEGINTISAENFEIED
ncbi:Pro-apoptotic serine protease NMA111 [Golovinomyces cichoracearum]|uniref:Pro-apoptotic serine protease NMA111 n=1 Tax=Golovinomyces cichoracearum TaxID=62708 RepID=A0A420ITR6_9PEZI|nr:Pro-apoptotic serine protease NMA111 [Golovinomyces cichoracearum]